MLGKRLGEGSQYGQAEVTAEQIIGKLREAEVLLSQGSSVGEASRKLGITEQIYCRWRKEYGGIRIDQAKRLRLFFKVRAPAAGGAVPGVPPGPDPLF